MKTGRWLILISILFAFCFAAPQPAHADDASLNTPAFNDLVWVLNNVPPGTFPITGSDLTGSQNFFLCIDKVHDDLDTIACVESFKNTNLGQQLNDQSGIPSWFWNLINVYVDVRTQDYWGLVENIGEAAACAVAQIITGGVDICGLLMDVINAVEDVAGLVVAFFEDVGKAAEAAADYVGCHLFGSGCDSGPPEDQVVYQDTYGPHVSDGVKAIEDVDDKAFSGVLDWLSKSALGGGHAQWAVNNAEQVYKNVVAAQWDSDMVKAGGILTLLANQRSNYLSSQNIDSLAQQAMPSGGFTWVFNRCVQDFSQTYKFRQVDRWLSYPSNNADVQTVKSNMSGNGKWCSDEFGVKKRSIFAADFQQYVSAKLCPQSGPKYVCPYSPPAFNTDNYRLCQKIMSDINYGDQNNCVLQPLPPPQCPTSLASTGQTYYCSTLDTYQYCLKYAALSTADPLTTKASPVCGFDDSKLGIAVASQIRDYLNSKKSSSTPGCYVKDTGAGTISAVLTRTGMKTDYSLKESPPSSAGSAQAKEPLAVPKSVAEAGPGATISKDQVPMTDPNKVAGTGTLTSGKSSTMQNTALDIPPVVTVAVRTQPWELACTRLKLQYECNKSYGEWAAGKYLPGPIVTCSYIPDSNYQMLLTQLAVALKTYPMTSAELDPMAFPDPKIDSQKVSALVSQKFFTVPGSPATFVVFNTNQNFTWPFDGVASPTIVYSPLHVKPSDNKTQTTLTAVPHGGSPITQGTIQTSPMTSGAAVTEATGKTAIANVTPAAQAQGGARTVQGASVVAQDQHGTAAAPQIAGITTTARSGSAPTTGQGAAPAAAPQIAGITTTVRSGTAPTAPGTASVTLKPSDTAALNTFKASSAGWRSVSTPQAATQGCACSTLRGQIVDLDQRSAALIKEGEALSASISSGTLDSAGTAKATQRLGEITKQLDGSLSQRNALAMQYNNQLKSAATTQQKR